MPVHDDGQALLAAFSELCDWLASRPEDASANMASGLHAFAARVQEQTTLKPLCLITTDAAYEDFVAGREAFIRFLGEPLLLEDFDLPNLVFCIFPDGTEVELALGRESQFNPNHGGPYRVLLDKKNLLAGTVFPRYQPAPAEQSETLRRLVY